MTPEQVHGRRWLILVLMAVCVVIGTMDNTILTVALAQIQQQLGASNSQLQWGMDSYTVVFAALLFTAGLLGDRYGRKKVLVLGLAVFGAASLYAAYASSPTELIVGRALMGIGVAVVPGGTLSILLNVFPAEERAKAIGRWSVAGGLAMALGPLLGGALLQWFWWGSALLINVPLCIVVIPLIGMYVPENKSPDPGRLDLAGLLLSIVGMGLLVYGIIRGGEDNDWVAGGVLGPIVGGVLVIAVLALVERRVQTPALDLDLFRRPLFLVGSIALSLAMFAVMGGGYVLSFYNQVLRGYSAFEAGLLMVPVALGLMYAAANSASWAQRFGPARVISTGLLLTSLPLVYYATLDADSWVGLIAFAQLVFGFGMGLVMATAPAVCMSVVPPAKAGAGAAVPNVMRQVGAAVGIAVTGAVLGSVYQGQISPSLQDLPASTRHDAGGSLGATAAAIKDALRQHGTVAERARRLTDTSNVSGLSDAVGDAFLTAQRAAMWTAGGIGLAGAVVALIWLPGPAHRRTEEPARPAGGKTADASGPDPDPGAPAGQAAGQEETART
ncbi:MFS transporter [Streptomyces sp. NPDC007905]|uniref:MFS transporter n=1 Tax=Streptomyces sp. NPDC007905 TaxID=3364788 RepID=UPI0036F0BF2C